MITLCFAHMSTTMNLTTEITILGLVPSVMGSRIITFSLIESHVIPHIAMFTGSRSLPSSFILWMVKYQMRLQEAPVSIKPYIKFLFAILAMMESASLCGLITQITSFLVNRYHRPVPGK